ncbi:hypothetical protein Cs7R123_37010 [Catellatospora sp. TT07R-123]|uniref:hypothetical protein n=1 Tax=Catellatospora sp. TT07R-123 TaxID=2733863 RepID=UPI001B2F33A3|nr:hypothetical protein [Catellatospora sp. TT07R-123]GHJ46359.1 hypothetical protein Cs7R123_37010 [Catellatospora sp. TT07R-123]
MKRVLAMTALAVMVGVALTGCRGGGARDGAGAPARNGGTTVTTPAPAKTAADPAAAAAQADTDLGEIDKMLDELDGQLKKAEESPTDAD